MTYIYIYMIDRLVLLTSMNWFPKNSVIIMRWTYIYIYTCISKVSKIETLAEGNLRREEDEEGVIQHPEWVNV